MGYGLQTINHLCGYFTLFRVNPKRHCTHCSIQFRVKMATNYTYPSHYDYAWQFSLCCTFNMYSSHPDSPVSSEPSESSLSKAKNKENTPNDLDNSRQVTTFKKWTTTLSLKQDMFRSFNDHLQL